MDYSSNNVRIPAENYEACLADLNKHYHSNAGSFMHAIDNEKACFDFDSYLDRNGREEFILVYGITTYHTEHLEPVLAIIAKYVEDGELIAYDMEDKHITRYVLNGELSIYSFQWNHVKTI